MRKLSLCALFLMMVPASAFATAWHLNNTYFIKFNFGDKYFGKEVVGVYAHVGVLKNQTSCGQNKGDFWDQVQHVKMNKVKDHYFKAITITSGTGECAPRDKGVIVQYWVYLKGEKKEKITASVMVPVVSSSQANPSGGGDQTAAMVKKFLQVTKDATRTECTLYAYGWAS